MMRAMEIYDFFNEEDIENEPADPAMAFSMHVTNAQRKLAEACQGLGDSEWEQRELSNNRHTFQNYVIGIAKVYKVEPFNSMEVPDHGSFGSKEERQFKTELDHYMTQLIFGNVRRLREDSAGIPPKLKDRFLSHLEALRQCVDQSDLSDARKAGLKKRLDEFEKTLERNRVNLWALSRLVFEILSVSANGLAFYDSPTPKKIAASLIALGAEAKAAEDAQRQLPPAEPMARLSPPRVVAPPTSARAQPKPRESFSADLDDEIPF